MKKSVEISKKMMIVLLFVAVFATAFSVAFASGETQAAYAYSDNFVKVFPTTNYFQSANPSLVSANDDFLVIYDEVAKTLFVRTNASSDTYSYSTDSFSEVQYLFLLGDVAFMQADGKYYTIDLTDKTATVNERTLPSPSEIRALASDGTYLYAHDGDGYVSVYDKNLNFAFGADNVYSKHIRSEISIAGENEYLYAFTYTVGNPFLTKFNVSTKETDSVALSLNVVQAYVGDVVFALENELGANQTHIVALDKESGAKLFDTNIRPQSFFAHRDRLYTIEDKSVIVYTLAEDDKSLIRTTSITMTGSDAFHLDNPTDLCADSDGIAIVDKNNNRIAFVDNSGSMTEQKFEETPLAIASSGRDFYCAFSNSVCKIVGNEIAREYQIDNVLDVAYLDKLYVLTNDGVYTAIGNSLIKIYDADNGKRLAVAQNGLNVYLLTSSSVICMNQNGARIYNAAEGDFSNAIDIAIDYQGKVFVAFEDKITSYYGTQSETICPDSSSLKATLTSIYLDGEKLLFTAKESFVGVMTNITATTKENFEKQLPDLSNDGYYFATANEGALNYSWDGRLENTSVALNDVYLVSNASADGDESGNYRYALVCDKLVKILVSDFNKVETTALNGEYVAKQNTTLYALPYIQTGAITINKDEKVTRISDVAGYDSNDWTLVEYGGKTYFVKSSDIEEYVVVVPEKDKVYGKANAERVGGLVNVYASPDTQSQIVMQIVDGSKVEVLQTLDDFYLVSFDGKIGYVEKAHLKIDGLTTVQIVAIVLAIIVALAGSAIFASIYLTRKNSDKEKNDSTPKRI